MRGEGFAVLHDFLGPEGSHPQPGLLVDGTTLYGAASAEGAGGLIFRAGTDGSQFTVLHQVSYDEGLSPNPGLILSEGTLYGTTAGQGAGWFGSVFRMRSDGTDFRVLKRFTGGSDGTQPSRLVRSGSFLFGTTFRGGVSNVGTLFRIGVDGTDFVVLKHFTGVDGANSGSGLALAGSVLYGTTVNGGAHGNGSLFRIRTDGSGFGLIKSFGGPGASDEGTNPSGGLELSGETLYGCTLHGGTDPGGTVFKIRTDGTGYQVLHAFTGDDGAIPYTELVLQHDTLYGTTLLGSPAGATCVQSGCGTVFKVRTDGTGFATLRRFSGDREGGQLLQGRLALAGNALIGATQGGGSLGKGVLFAIPRPLYPSTIAVMPLPATHLLAVWSGSPRTVYEVLASTRMDIWTPWVRVTSDDNGIFSIRDSTGDAATRFYRATIP